MAGTHRARGWSFSASVQRGWQRLTTTTATATTGPYSDSPPASPTLPAARSRRRPQSIGALSSPSHTGSGQQIPSRTTSSSSSSSFVSRLPPELWITIFELASSSSSLVMVDPLDITADHPWDTRNYPLQLLLSSYLATQDALRSLCLISRTLYAPALSLLMRHVWLHRRAHARRLARTLASRPNFGGLMRRIDVEMSDTSPGAIQVSALDVRDILRHCGGGLVCFTDKRGTYTNVGRWDAQYEAMLPALVAGGGGGSLRSVKVVQYAPATYGRRHWSALVEAFAGAALYELGIDLSLSTGAGVGAGAGGQLRYPTLRVLEVTPGPDGDGDGDALSTIASWDLPRLHTFRLLCAAVTAGTASTSSHDLGRGLTSLFTSHGTKLHHLELEAHALVLFSSTLLPNLRIITLVLALPLSPHQLQHDAHPNVERINIRNITHLASTMHHGTLLAHLSTFFCRSRFPRLRAIRVMCLEPSSTIMRLFWTRFGDQLTREGVVLEDIFGAQVGGGGGVWPRVHRTW